MDEDITQELVQKVLERIAQQTRDRLRQEVLAPFVYNFSTEKWETSPVSEPLTDEMAHAYLPNDPAVHATYRVHRKMGKSVEEAFLATSDVMLKRGDV